MYEYLSDIQSPYAARVADYAFSAAVDDADYIQPAARYALSATAEAAAAVYDMIVSRTGDAALASAAAHIVEMAADAIGSIVAALHSNDGIDADHEMTQREVLRHAAIVDQQLAGS